MARWVKQDGIPLRRNRIKRPGRFRREHRGQSLEQIALKLMLIEKLAAHRAIMQQYRAEQRAASRPDREWSKRSNWLSVYEMQKPQQRIHAALRLRLRKLLDGRHKYGSTMHLVGCTGIFLRQWMEARWTKQMNWDNYGEYWVIDHIVPC